MSGVTNEKLIADLKELAEELGKVPSSSEMSNYHKNTGKGASHSTYLLHFGSWKLTLKAAGLDTGKCHLHVSDEELCEKLRWLAGELGHAPLRKEVNGYRGKVPCSQTYVLRYGSWTKALLAAGLKEIYHYRRDLSDEELIGNIRVLADELGAAPTVHELSKCKWAPCYSTYKKRFKSWEKVLELAGVKKKPPKTPPKMTEAERQTRRKTNALTQLQSFVLREKRLPAPGDLGRKTQTPCYRTCVRYFGSWKETIDRLSL